MPKIPNNFFTEYEKIMLKQVAGYQDIIQKIYDKAIIDITMSAQGIDVKNKTFNLKDFPEIKSKIDNVLRDMRTQMTSTINQATKKAWDISNAKNDQLTKNLLGGSENNIDFAKLPKYLKEIYFNRNNPALQAFQKRQIDGLNLSQNIWKLLQPFKNEMEASLALGIKDGKSAAAMATDTKQYLNEPDKLFRRVRNEAGELQLSKAAKEYHPGQGTYRSSFKNAMRLTRTEINMGYRTSDQERWMQQPFVLGIEIKLSKAHPKYDICDPCAGIYPKDFIWSGWHPQCLCYRVPVLADDKTNKDLAREILGIKKQGSTDIKYITELPQGFKDYYANNAERIAGWKSKPYWLRDNPELLEGEGPVNIDYVKQAGKNITTMLTKKIDTQKLYTDPVSGGYNASRATFQEKLVDEYMKNGSTNLGTSYFLGGAPATGKSSLEESGIVKFPKGILVVDPDKIKGMLPEYAQMSKQKLSTAAAVAHEESSKLAKDITNNAAVNKLDVVKDGVNDGGYDDLVKKVEQQRRAGKKVIAEYITTDVEISVQRAYDRGVKTGRYIPEEYLRSMHKEISLLVPQLAKNGIFDELRLYDNNGSKGSVPKLIFEQKGKDVKIYDEVLYRRFLDKGK